MLWLNDVILIINEKGLEFLFKLDLESNEELRIYYVAISRVMESYLLMFLYYQLKKTTI
ncbi:hypothetical protein [Clostridium sp. DL-VIII]|uniref:hypothetical protein n=1 Tax=Clostridium sp. DL-VIII TaxID=641107 RepID=UPI00163E8E62|nr:hypothetical protein [Clostridium sp. DL-VIII]